MISLEEFLARAEDFFLPWYEFQALWKDTVECLPPDTPEQLVHDQLRLFFTRFLSKHGTMHGTVHLADISRGAVYGLNQRVNLLLGRGRVAKRMPTYFETCLVRELDGDGRGY